MQNKKKDYLIDTHAHLDFDKFNSHRAEVIRNAHNANVKKIITIGCNIESSKAAVKISKEFENVFCAVGIHPCDVKDLKNDTYLEEIYNLAKNNKEVKAIGEIGFDFYWEPYDEKQQEKHLYEQLQIAKECNLPIIVHSRNSNESIISFFKKHPYERTVLHCFPGGKEYTQACLDLGVHISFTGILTYKNAQEVVEAAHTYPLEKIMVETDCPFLAPQKYRGKRNEPAYTVEVAKKLAEIKNISEEEIVHQTTLNAEKFFDI